jgi:lysophospholipase L1-like esterase
MLVHVAKLALAPILYSQARRMRATTVELPEPEGSRSGLSGDGHPALRLLIAGDSSAVGVGAATQEEGFALALVRSLAVRINRGIQWQLVGQTGLTSEGVLLKLTSSSIEPADLAVITLGANDITREVSLVRALQYRREIADWLQRRLHVRQVVFSGLPEIQRFPAIPQPLAWYAGLHARRNNRAQARWARRQAQVHHADITGLARADLAAADGYHPAPALYAMIAERLAMFIAALLARTATADPGTAAYSLGDLGHNRNPLTEPEL